MARYDAIISKYVEEDIYADFIERTEEGSGSTILHLGLYNGARNFNILSYANDMNLAFIVIASSIALLSISTLSVLVVKKRKRIE